MIVALAIWLTTAFGIDLSDERIDELETRFYERDAHVHVGFGRRLVVHEPDSTTFSFGYERYLGKKHWVGVGFVGNYMLSTGFVRDPSRRERNPDDVALPNQWTFHPVRELELFYGIGGLWLDGGPTPTLVNRFGLGYRTAALHFAPVPMVYVDLVQRRPEILIGAQFEY